MPSVRVEIDLDEIDSDDLVEEIVRRLESKYCTITKEEKKQLRTALLIRDDEVPPNTCLRDLQINELFTDAKQRFTQAQLEERLM